MIHFITNAALMASTPSLPFGPNLLPITTNSNHYKSMKSISSNFRAKIVAVLAFTALPALAPSAHSAVIVTSGTLEAIGGSVLQLSGAVIVADYTAVQTDGIIHLVLDLGSAQNVSTIDIVNMPNTATNLSIRSLSIWIADDEDAPGFTPSSLSGYTTNVFADQILNPATNSADAVRTADVTDFTSRYVLFNLSSSFLTGTDPFAATGNYRRAQFGDISVTVIPEPSTITLLMVCGAVGLGCAFRRKAPRSGCNPL